MHTFLRRIRNKLVINGNIGKYTLYAVGEILLVVIGILIALQINNRNETKKTKATVDIYLQNLIGDLESDIKKLERNNQISSFRFHSLQYLLKISGQKPIGNFELKTPEIDFGNIWDIDIPEAYDKQFISAAFLWSNRVPNLSLNQSSLQELNSTGMFSYIEPNLKEKINQYYSTWEWRLGPKESSEIYDWAIKWQESIAEVGMITSNPYILDDPLSIFYNNPYRVALTKHNIREAAWVWNCSQIISENAQNLIQEIKNELNKN